LDKWANDEFIVEKGGFFLDYLLPGEEDIGRQRLYN